MNSTVFLLVLAALLALFYRRWMLHALIDGIQELADHFRGGGPPAPMHPSPVNDGNFLRKGFRKIEK